MSNKKQVIEQLKNWYVVDHILLNEDAKIYFKESDVFLEYAIMKASFLTNLFEFYDHVNIRIDNTKYKSSQVLKESAIITAKQAKQVSAILLTKPAIRECMTSVVIKESKLHKDVDVPDIVDAVTESQFLRYAISNAFVGLPLLESGKEYIPTDFKSEILYESFKLQRDSLIGFAKSFKNTI